MRDARASVVTDTHEPHVHEISGNRHQLRLQRLPVREQLQRPPLRFREPSQRQVDEFGEPPGQLQRPSPVPAALGLGERARVQPGRHEFLEVQRIALAVHPHQVPGRRVRGPAQGGRQQRVRAFPVERIDVDDGQSFRTPPRPRRADDTRQLVAHNVLQDQQRRVVEQMRVVDRQHPSTATREMLGGGTHGRGGQNRPSDRGQVRGDERRDRAERDPGRGDRGVAPHGGMWRGGEHLRGQAGLADPRRTGQQHRAVLGQRPQRGPQLTLAPDQGQLIAHSW